jgi:hypothetical protein
VASDPPEIQPLDGIGAADAHLGRAMPLPAIALPLARWVEVRAVGEGAEVEWNLDDTRPGAPGRLALYAGAEVPPREWRGEPQRIELAGLEIEHRAADLPGADASLTPVHELVWERGGLRLRLTGQGEWRLADLLAIAASVEA